MTILLTKGTNLPKIARNQFKKCKNPTKLARLYLTHISIHFYTHAEDQTSWKNATKLARLYLSHGQFWVFEPISPLWSIINCCTFARFWPLTVLEIIALYTSFLELITTFHSSNLGKNRPSVENIEPMVVLRGHGKDYNQCIWALSASTLSCPLKKGWIVHFSTELSHISHAYVCTVDVLQCLRIQMQPSGVFIDLEQGQRKSSLSPLAKTLSWNFI